MVEGMAPGYLKGTVQTWATVPIDQGLNPGPWALFESPLEAVENVHHHLRYES